MQKPQEERRLIRWSPNREVILVSAVPTSPTLMKILLFCSALGTSSSLSFQIRKKAGGGGRDSCGITGLLWLMVALNT